MKAAETRRAVRVLTVATLLTLLSVIGLLGWAIVRAHDLQQQAVRDATVIRAHQLEILERLEHIVEAHRAESNRAATVNLKLAQCAVLVIPDFRGSRAAMREAMERCMVRPLPARFMR